MTPDKPQDPQKGKVEETTPDEAKASKETAAAEKAPAKKTPARKPAAKKKTAAKAKAETAADDTGAETAAKDDAEPKAEAEAKPKAKAPAKKPASAKEEKASKPAAKPARTRSRDAEPAVVVRARAKYVRTSARKARLVCDHIRGKDVAEARAILAFTPRAAAEAWTKLLESAIANAEHNYDLVGEDLRVTRVFADEGPTLKRFRPRAMGRATRIRKRTSHLTIELAPKER
jgi:ribosomal protein L22